MGIDIESLKGIVKEIAKKVDQTSFIKNNIIDFDEISLFQKEINIAFEEGKLTLNEKTSIFNEIEKSIQSEFKNTFIQPTDAIKSQKPLIFNFLDFRKNEQQIPSSQTVIMYTSKTTKKAKNGVLTNVTETKDANGNVVMKSTRNISKKNGITTVNVERSENNKIIKSSFQYNITELEDYLINKGVDKKGNSILDFKNIPEIRKKRPITRTKQENELLEEFNHLIKLVTTIGTEYGVDPKHILSIIQEEVCFDGLGKRRGNVTGNAGKGYMQLTSAPIQDFLGKYLGKYKSGDTLQIKKYGIETLQLLNSKGFKVQNAKTPAEKEKLEKEIMQYLKDNHDEIFNIWLGTLVLRYYLQNAKGNLQTAAKNYNGSSSKIAYGQRVAKYAAKLSETVPNQTTYKYERRV